jgi:hypothetical protein
MNITRLSIISLFLVSLPITLAMPTHTIIHPTNDASGVSSSAIGEFSTASGRASTATGQDTTAAGDASLATGGNTIASGDTSTAMGTFTTASGTAAFAMGGFTTASGLASTAGGVDTNASGDFATATGAETIASGETSNAMGDSTVAAGRASTAMGTHTYALSIAEVALGRYNEISPDSNPNTWDETDAIFRIGTGTKSHRNDALRVMKSGVTQIKQLEADVITAGGTDLKKSLERLRAELTESITSHHMDQVANKALFLGLHMGLYNNNKELAQTKSHIVLDAIDSIKLVNTKLTELTSTCTKAFETIERMQIAIQTQSFAYNDSI